MLRNLVTFVAPATLTLLLAARAVAQPASPVERPPAADRRQEAAPPLIVASDQDARETRKDLEELLKRLPPAVGQVMRIDPSLMRNPSYLTSYPALGAFLQAHPDVAQSPRYYLEHVDADAWERRTPDPKIEAIGMWRDLITTMAVGAMMLSAALGLVWLLKASLDYRRWNRTTKVQTEVHTKLLDRFASNEDLMAYMQTPAGRRFLESAPLPMEAPGRPVAAPLSRILWSLQAGVVLATAGLGVLFVSNRVIEEVAQPLFAAGVLVLALGAGFMISAAASFILSRRLGLLNVPASPVAHGDTGAAGL